MLVGSMDEGSGIRDGMRLRLVSLGFSRRLFLRYGLNLMIVPR